MARKRPYSLIFDREVRNHLRAIESKYYSVIHKTIQEQLAFEPEHETRNRKPLERPTSLEATWELRFGPDNRFRVLYIVDTEQRQVSVLAIGVKRGNRLLIGGEELQI